MIAPEPFFEPRGTPFSEYHRIRALIELGHTVDLVTYPFGKDVSLPGLRVFRSLRPPFVNGIGIGPSWAKIPLDALVAVTSLRRALTSRYEQGLRHALLTAMADEIGETCNLTTLDGVEIVYLDRAEARWPLRLTLDIGNRIPIHCCASGKLFLALMHAEARASLLARRRPGD